MTPVLAALAVVAPLVALWFVVLLVSGQPRAAAVSVAVVVGALLAVVLDAFGGERQRVDLFDARGNRTGYAQVDREAGRVDLFDARGNRLGYGRVKRSGRADFLDARGALPQPSGPRR